MLINAEGVVLLQNSQYISFLRESTRSARSRIFVLQFLIDVRPKEDEFGEVRYLLNSLGEAASDGLDVRVLLAQVLIDHPTVRDINDVAATYLRRRGVQVRQLCDPDGSQQHAKAALFDEDLIVAGSHNWTPSAFRLNEEASLAVWSRGNARVYMDRFEALWQIGSEAT